MMLTQYIHHQIPRSVKIMTMSYLNLHPQKVKYVVDHHILLQRGNCLAESDKGTPCGNKVGVNFNGQRGKHDNRPNCISDERVQAIHEHIRSMPVYQTHYSRRQNLKRVHVEPVTEDKCSRIFCDSYNTGFKLPKVSYFAIFIDLQQSAPKPKLACCPALYLRSMGTYNVGIHFCSMGVEHMFMCDGGVAKIGSDEIPGCLIKYIRSVDIKARKLVYFF
ncbi:hypothetical protein PR048_019581 [Dryococelus australis]|uniref:Uncharacterized protein n=1 Tax=Dryococelus australis TaxID=614101 RepID=A0ABQ9H3Y0_9NEOP|nr:hypothetical protein PR048_019581 [Dryococelus australis]